jgi:hypothetical protein
MAVAMVQAIATARRRDVVGHRRAVAHVIAQMSVAVVSRALLVTAGVVGGAVAHDVDPDTVYVAALWLPVVAGAVVAHLVVPARRAARALPVVGDRHEAPRPAALPRLQPAR